MSTAQFQLQSTIYTTLNNDSNLTETLGASIFDEVPEGSSTPYVTIGEDTAVDYSTDTADGADITVNIDVWSEYKGSKECKQIMDRIHDLLHDSSLSITGFNLVNLRFEFSDILRDPDGVTRHGFMRFRAIILGSS